jgi:hypothetical protein
MNRIRKYGLSILIGALFANLFAQQEDVDRISYSFSWTPSFIFVDEGQFIFHIIPVDFESLIHYKPFKQLSFSSGLGYQRTAMTGPGLSMASSVIDNSLSYKSVASNYRIPMQISFHFHDNSSESDTYIKVEYINNIISDKTIYYEDDVQNRKDIEFLYRPSIGLGLGSFLRTDKAIGIRIEGGVDTYLRKGVFAKLYQLKVKIGIVF